MYWSQLSCLLRPPWTPERPRYPIPLKVRLMDCPGRGEEGSDVPSSDTSSILVREPRRWCSGSSSCSTRTPARPKNPAQPFVEFLL